jgi:hypothetical protein
MVEHDIAKYSDFPILPVADDLLESSNIWKHLSLQNQSSSHIPYQIAQLNAFYLDIASHNIQIAPKLQGGFSMNTPRGQKIQVQLGDSIPDEVYSNVPIINFTPTEFIIDYARFSPGMTKAKIHARIILNPATAKGFLKTLEMAMKNYEGKFGQISIKGQEDKVIGFGAGMKEQDDS